MTLCWLFVLLCSSPLWQTEGVEGWGISTVPSESECRPYIEKALKEHTPETPQEAVDSTGSEHETPPSPSADQEGSIEETEEATLKESIESEAGDEAQTKTEGESVETAEESTEEGQKETEAASEEGVTSTEEGVASTEETAGSTEATESQEGAPEESTDEDAKGERSSETEEETADQQSVEGGEESAEASENAETNFAEGNEEAREEQSSETPDEGTIEDKTEEEETKSIEETLESAEQEGEEQQEEAIEKGTSGEEVSGEQTQEETQETTESEEKVETTEDTVTSTEEHVVSEEEAENTGGEVTDSSETTESAETQEPETPESAEAGAGEVLTESIEETAETTEASTEEASPVSAEEAPPVSAEETSPVSAEETSPVSAEDASEDAALSSADETTEPSTEHTEEGSAEKTNESLEDAATDSSVEAPAEDTTEASGEAETSAEGAAEAQSAEETQVEAEVASETIEATPTSEGATESEQESTAQTEEQEQPAEEGQVAKEADPTVEDQLTLEFEVPKVRRQREHIAEILKLTPESAEVEMLLAKTIESTLKDLKRLYDSAIKPLEILYKYRDLSNRHFGDPEIFSKPLILFMGPWSGGKSTLINYLLDNEFQASSLRTGAEPSPAYFNILMWGEREEVLDGTQLAADWTFSGLQKFGQGLLDRLRGLKLNNPLLEKVNIVEIPGILEIRKQVERLFPFNDACQWFIDRADIIFLVYDPSKLDVGPETEAILDQLKGREYQTRILLNKADQVKPEELMRVQGTLIWNISPLMSSQEPPILYSTSLWSVPYEHGAPTRLLHAQERAFLRDLRTAVDKRVENKIASARRFAVRVRNHAKMVDCYLTTYYNHKTFFGNRKKVADDIIEHPQNYHIYEGLSTLTNISRYDLPDPEVYRDFFRLNPVYDFQRLSDTCTYFRGCPINRLDVAIAYDLPELVGKYKKQAERVLEAAAAQAGKS